MPPPRRAGPEGPVLDGSGYGRVLPRLAELTDGDRPAYVYFNNDNHGHAAFNALTLRRMAETGA